MQDQMESDQENLAAAMLAAGQSYGIMLVSNEVIIEPLHVVSPFMQQESARLTYTMMRDPVSDQASISAERLSFFFENHQMRLFVYAYEPSDNTTTAAVFEFPLDVWSLPPSPPNTQVAPSAVYGESSPGSEQHVNERVRRSVGEGPDPNVPALVASIGRAAVRGLARNLEPLEHPILYRFAIGTRSLMGAVVEITRSDLVDLHAPDPVRGVFGGIFVPCSVNGAGFEVAYLQGDRDGIRELESIRWAIPESMFLGTALSRILPMQTPLVARAVQVQNVGQVVVVID
jgi:hypothetical protein